MRSLKKALSLVLVLALMLSVCIFSASATNFSDDSQIEHKEAVDVLTEIGVIDGMGDGTFNPTGTLTRAQASKIVCYILLGSDTSKLSGNASSFTDVVGTPDEWAAPYIEYCYNAGIVGGYGDGRFGPSDQLTGFQFAKMLLCALGYDAAIEGYTGASWSVAVAKGIIDASLDDDLPGGFNYNAPITRDEACQIAFNALKADMVEYATKGTTIVTGDDTTVVTGASQAEAKETSAAYGSNIDARVDPATGKFYLQMGEYYFHDLKRTVAGGDDDFGRPSNTWKDGTTEIGTYTDTANLEKTYDGKVTLGTLYNDIGRSTIKELESGTWTMYVYEDGINLTDGQPLGFTPVNPANINMYARSGDTGTFQGPFNDGQHMGANIDATGAGSKTELFIDDVNNIVTVVVVNEYLLKATGDFAKDELKVELKGVSDLGAGGTPTMALKSTKLDQGDFTSSDLSVFKEKDYIVANMAADRLVGGVYQMAVKEVAPATLLTGTVDRFTRNVNKVEFGSVTIDGTAHLYTLMCPFTDGYDAGFSVGEAAKVVTDAAGFVMFVDDAVANDKYLFIYQFKNTTGLDRTANVTGDAFFPDGTSAAIIVDEVKNAAGNKIDGTTLVAGGGHNFDGWYSYSTGSDGKYDLRELTNQASTGSYGANTFVIDNGKTAFIRGVGRSGNASTAIIVNDAAEDDTTLYTGATKAPDVKTNAGGDADVFYHWNNKGAIDYAFVKVTGSAAIDDGATTSDMVYILFNDGTANDGKNNVYVEVESIQKGAWAYMNVKDGMFNPATDCFQRVYKVKTNSDGYVTGWTTIDDAVNLNGKGDKYYYFDTFNPAGGDRFNYDKGTLMFAGQSVDVSNCDLYLVIVVNPSTQDIVDDAGMPADFTNMHISGDQLKSALNGYDVIAGSVAGVRADDNSSSMSSLYVTVFAVQPS